MVRLPACWFCRWLPRSSCRVEVQPVGTGSARAGRTRRPARAPRARSVGCVARPALSTGEPGGDVQQPVAQRLRFGLGQIAVQEQVLGPGDQIDREHHDGQPGLVDRERAGREVVQAGVLRAADAVLDPGVRAVAGVEVGELPERGVGGERGVAPPVGLFERVELRAGVRAFATHDHPDPDRVAGQGPGGRTPVISASPAPSRCPPSASTASAHTLFGMAVIAARSLSGDRPADRELAAHRLVAESADVGEELPGAAGGIGADQDRGAVAVLRRAAAPARRRERRCGQRRCCCPRCPRRSVRGEELAGVVAERQHRVVPEAALERRRRLLLLELAQVRAKVCKVAPSAPGFVRAGWRGGVGVGRERRCRRRSGPGRCCSCRARRR